LVLSPESQDLYLQDHVLEHLTDQNAKVRAARRIQTLLDSIASELSDCSWYEPEQWLKKTMDNLQSAFDGACERWRSLYRTAQEQSKIQSEIFRNPNKSQQERDQANRLANEAKQQLDFLLSESKFQSDFYSYRYFASEGFLPGYNFPRLPLSAYIPGKRSFKRREDYINRPRFLAISEFGPGSFIYHEGARYIINRVISSIDEGERIASERVKLCGVCGHIYPISEGDGLDNCEMCNSELPLAMNGMFRMRNVSTIRRQRISSDEEERIKYGYQIATGFQFKKNVDVLDFRIATVEDSEGKEIAELKYGQGASLWRLNLGWANSASGSPNGFLLDLTKGVWIRQGNNGGDEELEKEGTGNIKRVIPYVKDTKNCLIFNPKAGLDSETMYSLLSALKQGIQLLYQLEDFELAAEALPATGEPSSFLFYESTEGGAGVLRQLVDNAQAIGDLAKEALRLCHFDPETGEDQKKAAFAAENCVSVNS
jgi:hypothetical protein